MTDMLTPEGDRLRALLRSDFGSFARKVVQETAPDRKYLHNWHLDAMIWQVERIVAGDINRLIVSVAPRSLKSTIFSVALPAFFLGLDPTIRVIVVSYSQDLAQELAYQTRRVMETDWYRETFPGTRISADKRANEMFKTTRNGFRLATSIGGPITGFGADVIIIDDPLKPEDAFSETKRQRVNDYFSSTLLSRLDDKARGSIVIVMQRLHEEDLVGHVLPMDDWHHLKLPAIATRREKIETGTDSSHMRQPGDILHPARETRETLEIIRKTLGPQAFSAQYQQDPVPPEGALFKLEQFGRYDEPPPRHLLQYVIQSWDLGVTADSKASYSAMVTLGVRGEAIYVLDVYRDKLDYPDLQDRVLAYYKSAQPNLVVIEKSHLGAALYSEFARRQRLRAFKTNTPKGSKVERATAETPVIAAGRVHLPHTAPWLSEFEKELLTFPGGRYDDQVDAFTQGLYAIRLKGDRILRKTFP